MNSICVVGFNVEENWPNGLYAINIFILFKRNNTMV